MGACVCKERHKRNATDIHGLDGTAGNRSSGSLPPGPLPVTNNYYEEPAIVECRCGNYNVVLDYSQSERSSAPLDQLLFICSKYQNFNCPWYNS